VETLKLIDFFFPFFLLLLWFLFGIYSDTANNHGRLIAFFFPMAALAFIVAYFLFGLSRIFIYPFFMLSGKKEKYNDLVYTVKNPWLWGFKEGDKEVNEDQIQDEKENK